MQVLIHPTRQMPQPSAEERVLLVGDPLHQVAVVRDDDQGAGPGVKQLLHRGEHVNVHIVRGLVYEHQVRFRQQHKE